MKYFVNDNERKNTVYHEFQKGKWNEKTNWKSDSICLSDDMLYSLGVEELFVDTIPNYNCFGESVIDRSTWNRIMNKAEKIGGQVYECISEADIWVQQTFQEYDVFTIIGI